MLTFILKNNYLKNKILNPKTSILDKSNLHQNLVEEFFFKYRNELRIKNISKYYQLIIQSVV